MFFMYLMRLTHQLLSNRTSTLVVACRSQSDRTADAIGDEKRVYQKSNKMSCKPKSIDF